MPAERQGAQILLHGVCRPYRSTQPASQKILRRDRLARHLELWLRRKKAPNGEGAELLQC